MSTPVAGALAVTPLYATLADAIVSWDDAGATWRSLGTIPVGGGTVTSIAGGTGITVSPSPIVGAGTASLTVPVSVANGGTGTMTAMTAGSVLFAGASGVYAQDNANLFWDDGNNRLGIGTASPGVRLDLVGGGIAVGNGALANSYQARDAGGTARVVLGVGTNAMAFDVTRLRSAGGGVSIENLAGGTLVAIQDAGNVGIGPVSPRGKLEMILGAADPTPLASVVSGGIIATDGGGLGFQIGISASSPWPTFLQARSPAAGGGAQSLALNPLGGNVGIGTAAPGHALVIGGNIQLTGTAIAYKPGGGTWTDSSDIRTKRAVADYTTGLEAVVKLRPVSFQKNGRGGTVDDGKTYVGLIANEAMLVMPEMVGVTEEKLDAEDAHVTEILTLEATALIYALVNSTKTLAARVAALEKPL